MVYLMWVTLFIYVFVVVVGAYLLYNEKDSWRFKGSTGLGVLALYCILWPIHIVWSIYDDYKGNDFR